MENKMNNRKNSGWFEDKSTINEKGKPVAKEHSEAILRAKYAKDKPSCVPVCAAPCGHKKEVVKFDEDEIKQWKIEDAKTAKTDKEETDTEDEKEDDDGDKE